MFLAGNAIALVQHSSEVLLVKYCSGTYLIYSTHDKRNGTLFALDIVHTVFFDMKNDHG